MAEGVQSGLVQATQVARETPVRTASNSIHYAAYGDTRLEEQDLHRIVEAVPTAIAAALSRKAYYFVPLAMSESRSMVSGTTGTTGTTGDTTLIAPVFTTELGDQAICHRNVALDNAEGVFISTRLLGDRFALAFEFFINVGHAFVDAAGVPESFDQLVWAQAVGDVRGETSLDAWESRNSALSPEARLGRVDGKPVVDEKAKLNYIEAAFSDAVAIYMLSLAVDFDYSELREREYPLLAPQALAERLRLAERLFPPNTGYEFAIRYRRRA